MNALTCPIDGQIIESGVHDTESPGEFECPRCRHRWDAYEVIDNV